MCDDYLDQTTTAVATAVEQRKRRSIKKTKGHLFAATAAERRPRRADRQRHVRQGLRQQARRPIRDQGGAAVQGGLDDVRQHPRAAHVHVLLPPRREHPGRGAQYGRKNGRRRRPDHAASRHRPRRVDAVENVSGARRALAVARRKARRGPARIPRRRLPPLGPEGGQHRAVPVRGRHRAGRRPPVRPRDRDARRRGPVRRGRRVLHPRVSRARDVRARLSRGVLRQPQRPVRAGLHHPLCHLQAAL